VPWLSPSGQTVFITALASLEEAEDRPVAIEQVLELESLDEGRFLVQAAQMLAWIDEKESPVTRLVRGERTLVAITRDRREIIPLPVDHLLWTPALAALVERRGAELHVPGLSSRELWLFKTASDLSRGQLEGLGWVVETEMGDRIQKQPMAAEQAAAPSG